MAGILNSIYVVLAVGIAVIGFGVVLQGVSETKRGNSRWIELVSLLIAVLFLLILGAEFLL